jgi:soluble lytic murein transglycosylase-like protein
VNAQVTPVPKKYVLELLLLCKEYDLSPYTIAKLIEWESAWDANALNVNPNGTLDIGLMQLNSAYIDEFTYKYRGGVPFDPYDWKASMEVGIKHLAVLKRHTGTQWGMVAAYNMGLSAYMAFARGKRTLPQPTKNMTTFVFSYLTDKR